MRFLIGPHSIKIIEPKFIAKVKTEMLLYIKTSYTRKIIEESQVLSEI